MGFDNHFGQFKLGWVQSTTYRRSTFQQNDINTRNPLANMAILWSETIDGNEYEIRSAGASIRLYRNGVHHSQFNPNRPLAGGIWDLLTITTLFRPAESIDRALILGFGAGAAGRLIQELTAATRVVGIDLDPIHLSIADSFFDCGQGCELIAADAVQWVEQTAEEEATAYAEFDWILDDLYGEEDSIPVRVGPETLKWFRQLEQRLASDGMLVVNLVEPDKISELPIMKHPKMIRSLPHCVELSLTAYDNRILAFSRQPFKTTLFHERLTDVFQKFPACRSVRNKYRIRSLNRS